jgi:tyrosyl-tRNA synthetase
MLHGADAARAARDAAEKAFEQGALSDDLPTVDVPRAELEAGMPLANLAVRAGLASSNGEARRLAQGGGLRLNDVQEMDASRTIGLTDLGDGVIKLAAGKKKIVLIRPA